MIFAEYSKAYQALRKRYLLPLMWIALVGARAHLVAGAEEGPSYNFQIAPILSDRCYQCHGPDAANQDSPLRLDTKENALADLGGYAAVVPGDPEASELHRRIWSVDGDQMPPPESKLSLTDEEKRLLDAWIEAGAPFDKHWAFKKVPPSVSPPNAGEDWAANEIDRFVADKLAQEGLEPGPEASPEVLIRRVTFALTGLPPTVDEIERFVADDSPQAYERLVDRLLDSPRFGERMSVDWLDLARYADTYGYQEDRYRDMWPWRDWVIKSFNRNMPFDQFITWQLAGDLLPGASNEQILATAFNRLHRQTSEGGSDEEEFRTEYVVDRVDTFGAAFLGLTVGCARCHDHKFDPLTQKEYFQLSAYFNNIDESGLYPFFTSSTPTPTLDLVTEEQAAKLAMLKRAVSEAESALQAIRDQRRGAFNEWSESTTPEVQSKGLVGDFSFDNIDPDKPDVVPNRGDKDEAGSLEEDPKLAEGKAGKSLLFDGEDSFSTLVGGEFRRYDPFTIALWIKTPDVKQRAVIWHRSRAGLDSGSRGYQLLIEDGKLSAMLAHFWPGNALAIRTTHAVPLQSWVHVTVTYDGSSSTDGLRIFLDGRRADVEILRDELTRTISYDGEFNIVDQKKVADIAHKLVVGQRFRDRGFIGGQVDELKIYNRSLSDLEITALANSDSSLSVIVENQNASREGGADRLYDFYLQNYDEVFRNQLEALKAARQRYCSLYDAIPEIMVMHEMSEQRPAFVLERGSYDAPGEEVERDTPAWLPPRQEDWPNDRLGLARWLTDPAHPLTSRVTVNRFWQLFFGHAIVSTPLDFGSQGNPPTHPELLDWLAQEFIVSGWDTKRLVKSIVMSSTYKQSSDAAPKLLERDPDNMLLARGPKFRLPAEMLRDSNLFVSDQLVEKVGGPPVKPYQPAGLWKETGWVAFERDPGEGSHRRSVYTYWKRTSPPPSMMTLDCPDREVSVAQRQVTSTPLQPLILLNDPQYVESARALAETVMHESPEDPASAIELAYRKCTSRSPTLLEIKELMQLYNEQLQAFRDHPERAEKFLRIGDREVAASVDHVKLAAMATTMSVIMNLYESITVE